MTLRLATGPVSWGVDFADAEGNPPWREVLDGVVAAGYTGIELGPLGYFPGDAAFGDLTLTAGFIFEPLHEPATLGVAARTAGRVVAAGGRYLVIIDRPGSSGTRRAIARAVAAVADLARAAGLVPLVHPHAGTGIGFDDRLEPLLRDCGLCLDTGHALLAGCDPVDLYRRWADRIPYLHLKDVDPARVGGDFWADVAAGAFRPLGQGALDVPRLLEALRGAGYDGWLTVEQDRAPGGDPVADLVESRRLLEELA